MTVQPADEILIEATKLFNAEWASLTKDVDLSRARVGGRATKENPNKEDADFWARKGPEWVKGYIEWRQNNPDWKIWKNGDVPAIELGLTPEFAGVPVKMVIDRVFEVNGELVVVDLKTSQNTPSSSLQLGFYRAGLKQVLGINVKWGAYWMARQSGTGSLIDLSHYSDDMIDYLVSGFDKARKSGIFLPNLNNCNRCGLTDFCQFTTKGKQ
jgi:hypothetical protein